MNKPIDRILSAFAKREPAPAEPDAPAPAPIYPYRMLQFILSEGFADDAMAAARKAGATGGTVLHGHGTARPTDAEFFGVKLVPEKEILLVLVPEDKAQTVLDAVRALPCFAEKGAGVVAALPVSDFALLGQ